ncbi:hypothetical protein HMI51_00760 [Corallococcus coralloides]|nr:hypothetical protein [Corallococcus coralloides]
MRGSSSCPAPHRLPPSRLLWPDEPGNGPGGIQRQQRLPPASTFKIPHALIALEEGVLKPDEVFRWDGTPHAIQARNQDQTLDTAMRRSALWVFQGLATRLGRDREEAWMKRLHVAGPPVRVARPGWHRHGRPLEGGRVCLCQHRARPRSVGVTPSRAGRRHRRIEGPGLALTVRARGLRPPSPGPGPASRRAAGRPASPGPAPPPAHSR